MIVIVCSKRRIPEYKLREGPSSHNHVRLHDVRASCVDTCVWLGRHYNGFLITHTAVWTLSRELGSLVRSLLCFGLVEFGLSFNDKRRIKIVLCNGPHSALILSLHFS